GYRRRVRAAGGSAFGECNASQRRIGVRWRTAGDDLVTAVIMQRHIVAHDAKVCGSPMPHENGGRKVGRRTAPLLVCRRAPVARVRAMAVRRIILGLLSLLVACAQAQPPPAQVPPAAGVPPVSDSPPGGADSRFDAELSGYPYPFPVQFLELASQQERV